ncbi:MAG: hypothetical protein FWF63_01090 [Fibromonadales bacterium]|nr:hypothetical protein [Fibromonadales bacterium]
MQAVAFKTEIENDVIRIPREYCDKIPAIAIVTISEFAQTENDSWENMLSDMRSAKKIKDFKIYSKNEINDR